MCKYLLIIFLFITPLTLLAQQGSEDDPFKRDPIFNKSLDDLIRGDREGESESNEQDSAETAIKRLSNRGIDLGGGFEAGPYYSNTLFSQYPNLSGIHYNRVNGLFLGFKKERMQWHRSSSFLNIPRIHPHGFIGYGTASKQWDYAIGLERLFGERKHLMIGAEYHNATATEDYWRTGLIETSLTSFFAAYDYLDYYEMEGFGAYAVLRSDRWMEAAFSYNNDTFSSSEINTRYSLFGRDNTYRLNPPVDSFSDEIDLERVNLSFSFNPRRVLLADKFTFSATIGTEMADNGGTDDQYTYNKFWSELRFFYNFEPGSILKWRIKGGTITGNAPDFKQFFLGGIGSLRGSPYKLFRGDQMLLSNLEVQFGQPANRAGAWLNDYNIHLLVFLDSGWTNEERIIGGPGNDSNKLAFSNLQHDAGIGLGTDAFRFELAWPLKTFDSTPALWLRFNPTF